MMHRGTWKKIDTTKTFIGILKIADLPNEIVINLRELHILIVECLDLEPFFWVIYRLIMDT